MRTTIKSTAVLLAAGMMLAGNSLAQQTPAAPAKPATSTKSTSSTSTAKTGTTKTGTATGTKTTAAPAQLTTEKQKASYAIGMSIGKRLHDDGAEVDTTVILRGLKDGLAGAKTAMTDDEARTTLMNFQKTMHDQLSSKYKKEGDDYRAANKAKPGVMTLPSGLQYKVITQGTGPKPSATDSVVCNYRGTFIDGKEFDSSYKRNEPATFPVTGVIKGWTEALQMMSVGSKWQLVIPPDLAYGEQGRPTIPPNSTLVFEVELVKIAEKKPETPQPQAGAPQAQPQAAPQGQPQSAAPNGSTQNPK